MSHSIEKKYRPKSQRLAALNAEFTNSARANGVLVLVNSVTLTTGIL